MADYTYPARTAALTNAKLLRQQIAALSLPGWTDFDRDGSGLLHVRFSADLTAPQKSSLDTAIANHDPSQFTAEQQAQIDAAAAKAVARNVDSPITALEAARTAIAAARTALQSSIPALNNEDNTIQALTSPTVAQLTTRVKALSARNRTVAGDVVNALQALLDGETAIRDAIVALRERTT